MYEFKLPDLGEGVHEGEILKWYVQPGETVEEDASLVDVETDKAAVTIPSPVGGKVVSLGGKVGDVVTVGSVLVTVDDGSAAAAPAPAAAAPPAPAPVEPAREAPVAPAPPAPPPAAGRPVPAAPATRRLARELKVDIRQVPPTGPGGRVTPEDVRRFASGPPAESGEPAPAPEPTEALAQAEQAARAASTIPFLDLEPLPDFSQWGPVEVVPLRSIRRLVARRMVTSMTLVPHVAHMDEADVTVLEEFRRKANEADRYGTKLTLLPFVMKAVAAGLKATPSFNASLEPFKQEIIYKKYINLGFAVDTGRGLVVPVVRGAGCRSILEMARDLRALAEKAREGKLEVADMKGGTFTITNVGPLGGTAMIPTINYPEVAILGMGRVQEKPVVRDGQIVIRKILPLTLAFDHRIADGADAARFVTELARQLADPDRLLLEA